MGAVKRVAAVAAVALAMWACGGSGMQDDPALQAADSWENVYAAAKAGNLEAVQHFIQTRNWDPNAPDSTGVTPLNFAARSGNVEMVRLMVAHGADPRKADVKGNTPLSEAERAGHRDVAQLLRDMGGVE